MTNKVYWKIHWGLTYFDQFIDNFNYMVCHLHVCIMVCHQYVFCMDVLWSITSMYSAWMYYGHHQYVFCMDALWSIISMYYDLFLSIYLFFFFFFFFFLLLLLLLLLSLFFFSKCSCLYELFVTEVTYQNSSAWCTLSF